MSIQEAISKRLAGKAKLPMSQREQFFERFLLLLTRRLKQGETISITGLGSFSIRDLNRRGGVEVAFTDEVQKENRIRFKVNLHAAGFEDDPLAGLMAGMVSAEIMDELAEQIINVGTIASEAKPDASAGIESLLESDFSDDFSSGFLVPDIPDESDAIPEIDDLSLPDFEIPADRIREKPIYDSTAPLPVPEPEPDENPFASFANEADIETEATEDDLSSFFTDAMPQSDPDGLLQSGYIDQPQGDAPFVPPVSEPEEQKPAAPVKQEPEKPKSVLPADSEEAIKDSILQSMFQDATEEFPEDDEFSQAFMQAPSQLPLPDEFAGVEDDLLPDTGVTHSFDDMTPDAGAGVPIPEPESDADITSNVFLQDTLSSPVSVTEEELTESFQQVFQDEQEKIEKQPAAPLPETTVEVEEPMKEKRSLFSFLSFLSRKKVKQESESDQVSVKEKKKSSEKPDAKTDAPKKEKSKPKNEKPESDGDEEFPIVKLVILFAALMPLTLGFVYVHFSLKPSWWPFTTETELPFFEKPVQGTVIYPRQFDIPVTFPYGKNEVTSYLDLHADLMKSYPVAGRPGDTVTAAPHQDTITEAGTKDTLQKSQKKETVTEEKKEEKKPVEKKETSTKTTIPTGELKQVENLIYSDGTTFSVQVSSQKRKSLAETTAVDMKRKGYTAMIREIELKSGKKKGTWYRVFVTGIQSIEKAREIRKKEAAQ